MSQRKSESRVKELKRIYWVLDVYTVSCVSHSPSKRNSGLYNNWQPHDGSLGSGVLRVG